MEDQHPKCEMFSCSSWRVVDPQSGDIACSCTRQVRDEISAYSGSVQVALLVTVLYPLARSSARQYRETVVFRLTSFDHFLSGRGKSTSIPLPLSRIRPAHQLLEPDPCAAREIYEPGNDLKIADVA